MALNIKADGSRTFTANQSLGGNKFTNVSTPTASTDAANKSYVDTEIVAASTSISNAFARDGSNVATANISMSSNTFTDLPIPTVSHHAATKAYVDQEVALITGNPSGTGFHLLDGSRAWTADNNAGGFKLAALGTPSSDMDASTKKYVDDVIGAAGTTTNAFLKDGSVTATANWDMGSNTIINVSTPTSSLHVANKAYVDAIMGGLETTVEVPFPDWVTGQDWVEGQKSSYNLKIFRAKNVIISSTTNPESDTGNWDELSPSGAVADASETVKGILELATQAEVDAGSDTSRAITPATLASASGIVRTDAEPTMAADIKFSAVTNGLVIEDATSGTFYRLGINSGILTITSIA